MAAGDAAKTKSLDGIKVGSSPFFLILILIFPFKLWSEWCLYDVLQDLMNRELEDEKVSVTIGKRTMFSIGCFPSVSYTHLDVYKRQHYISIDNLFGEKFDLIEEENISLLFDKTSIQFFQEFS